MKKKKKIYIFLNYIINIIIEIIQIIYNLF